MSGIVSDKKLAKAHADFAAVDTGPDPACESDAVAAAKAEKAAAKAETEPAKGEAEPAKPAKPVKTTAVPEYASSEHRDLCNDCHEASSGLGMERADEIAWLKAMNVTSYRSLDMDVLRERMAYLLLVTRTCELADEAGYPNDKEDAMFKHFGVDQWWELDAKVIQDAHDKFAETVKAFETAAAD
jgi:hypothetical protein